jgi:AcrR family transcriptional regulator
MKTAEKILLMSLDLFNNHGERNITSVNIATEMNISPGNLYYHFKGKEKIVKSLVDMYCKEMSMNSQKAHQSNDDLDSFFSYLLTSLESLHLFRFIYQNVSELISLYPSIKKSLQINAASQKVTLKNYLSSLQDQGILENGESSQSFLIDIISLTMYQSLNFYQMQGDKLTDPEVIYRSLMTIFFSIQPVCTDKNNPMNSIKEKIINKSLGK